MGCKYFSRISPSQFESALRTIDQSRDKLLVCWLKGMGALRWRVSLLGDEGRARLTSAAEIENYDLAFYPIPWADSVPAGMQGIVENLWGSGSGLGAHPHPSGIIKHKGLNSLAEL